MTNTQLISEINTQFPDNTSGLITAARQRTVLTDMVNSAIVPVNDANAASIQAAIDQAAVNGGTVFIQNTGQPFVTSVPIRLKNHVRLVGLGDPVIQLSNGANCDIIQTNNSVYTLLASNSATLGSIYDFGIEGMTLDGNRANQSPSNIDQCNGLAFYGHGFTLEDLIIRNIKGHGARFGSYRAPSEEHPGTQYKSQLSRVEIYTTGRHGIWNTGPSDGFFSSVMTVDASQEVDDTYDGLHVSGGYGTLRADEFHPWHNAATTNRMRYGLYVASDSGGVHLTNSDIEGGRRQVFLGGGANTITGGGIFVGQSNNAQIVIGGSYNKIDTSYAFAAGFEAPTVLQIGNGSGVFAYDINLRINLGHGTVTNIPIVFNGTDDLGGAIEVYCFGSEAASLSTGTKSPYTRGRIWQTSPTRLTELEGENRTIRLVNVGANTSFVVPTGYAIRAIYLVNIGGLGVTGGLRMGTTAGGNDVITAKTIAGASYYSVSDTELLKRFLSAFVDTTVYVEAVTSWGANTSLQIAIDLMQVN